MGTARRRTEVKYRERKEIIREHGETKLKGKSTKMENKQKRMKMTYELLIFPSYLLLFLEKRLNENCIMYLLLEKLISGVVKVAEGKFQIKKTEEKCVHYHKCISI